jgi:uncharacterized phage protein (TIGR02218 family)
MKPASGSLTALLNSSTAFLMADLLTVSFFDGSTLRLTDADMNLVVGGNTFKTNTDQGTVEPIFKRGKTRCVVGLEVDTLDVTLLCGQTVQVGGISMTRAAMNGVFDGARVKLERVFMPTWGDTSPGTVILFEGAVAGVDPSSTEIRLVVKSELDKLNVAMPRNVFMPACGHVLYGPGCGVVKAAYTVTGTVGAGATTTSVPSNRAEAADYFRLGVMVFTSGPCAGSRRAVRAYSGGTFTPVVPLPAAPANENTFSVAPGCDHSTGAQGCAKFANLNRFRGFPYVPRPETAR